MGASLFMQQRIGMEPGSSQYIGSVVDALVYALGSGVGWLFGYRSFSCYPRKNGLHRCTQAPSGFRYHLYYRRSDGNGIYVLLGSEYLIFK